MTPRARLIGCGSFPWMGLALGVMVLWAAACAARSPIAVPADLPNRTDQGEFQLRWALVRESATVRAVGLMESHRIVPWATLALFGVDRNGRVVSRGQSDVQAGFGGSRLPFEVALRPTGREERFELVVIHAHQGKPGD